VRFQGRRLTYMIGKYASAAYDRIIIVESTCKVYPHPRYKLYIASRRGGRRITVPKIMRRPYAVSKEPVRVGLRWNGRELGIRCQDLASRKRGCSVLLWYKEVRRLKGPRDLGGKIVGALSSIVTGQASTGRMERKCKRVSGY
jgi:hypothetical protein